MSTKKYPETDETPMGHLNQTRANVRSTKPKQVLLPEATDNKLKQLIGKKEQDVFISVVNTWTITQIRLANSRYDREEEINTSW